MQVQSTPVKTVRPGRGFVITGIVMMVVAVIGVMAITGIFGGSIDVGDVDRDVVVIGEVESEVPGRVRFRILEDISAEGDDSMTVGVAADAVSGVLECRILDASGEEIEVRAGSARDSFVAARIDAGSNPVVVADRLPAGDYSAVCSGVGEPSESAADRTPVGFTVGRILTVDEVFEFARPVFAIIAAVAVGGVIGLIGLILMIVGLVIGNRSRRGPQQPPPGW